MIHSPEGNNSRVTQRKNPYPLFSRGLSPVETVLGEFRFSRLGIG